MILKLVFDNNSQNVFVPDNTIDICDSFLQKKFLDWVEEQPDCICERGGIIGLSYDENDFVRFINEIYLKDHREKSYVVDNSKHVRIKRVLTF